MLRAACAKTYAGRNLGNIILNTTVDRDDDLNAVPDETRDRTPRRLDLLKQARATGLD